MLSPNAQPEEGAKQKFYGTGRRKESVARVFLTFGTGKISINGRTVDEYFRNVNWRNRAVEPMKFTETSGSVDVMATVNGGGVGGQSGALRMGLSRALPLQSGTPRRAAQERFSDARFAHEGTQEIRAEGRP